MFSSVERPQKPPEFFFRSSAVASYSCGDYPPLASGRVGTKSVAQLE
jgi:hypothetical protein